MEHETDKASEVIVTDSSENFDTWLNRKYISEDTKKELKKADVLLVPMEIFRGEDIVAFPVLTEEIYQFLKTKLSPEKQVDICIEDKDFKELALHSALLVLGSFVVTMVVAPMLVNALYDYIKSKILNKIEKRGVKVSLTIINKDGTAKNLTYEGDAEKFVIIKEELEKLNKGKNGS